MSFNGRTSASQAENAGSIPVIRSTAVDVIDLGFGDLPVPKGKDGRLLRDLLPCEAHAAFCASMCDDPDLATT